MDDNSVLCVGLVCLDIIAETESFPVEDTDQRIPDLCYRRGGNASNSSSVLAQLGLKCEFLGNLADAVELEFIQKDFSNHSILLHHCPILPNTAFPTSIVIINSYNGSRTILHHPKNLPELSYAQFDSVDVNHYHWIHFEGRSNNVDNIKRMVDSAQKKSSSVKISVEIEKARPMLNELLSLGDVVFVSKEYAQYSGFSTMVDAVKGFLPLVKPGAIIVCAWGDKGAAAGRNEDVITARASPSDQIVDTLGAGDTFNAAFIYTQMKNIDWKKGLQCACLIAGFKIGQKGFQGIEKFKAEALTGLSETLEASGDLQKDIR